jgi:hypothetical protein
MMDDDECLAVGGMRIDRETEVLGENLPHCDFVHHKCPDRGSNPGHCVGSPPNVTAPLVNKLSVMDLLVRKPTQHKWLGIFRLYFSEGQKIVHLFSYSGIFITNLDVQSHSYSDVHSM